MTSARQKGLAYVHEVKRILQLKGYKLDGPGYGCAFYDGGMRAVHRDFFGCFDLLSYSHRHIDHMEGHQVSTLTNKAAKVKNLIENKIQGYVWCRISKDNYRVFYVYSNGREEELFIENI